MHDLFNRIDIKFAISVYCFGNALTLENLLIAMFFILNVLSYQALECQIAMWNILDNTFKGH